MIEVQILIPINDNDGETFTAEHHEAFEAYVADRFLGISLLEGAVIGTWIDEGQTYHDINRVYLVAMVTLTDGGKLKEVLSFAKAHYRQEAIYFRYLGISEIYEG